MKQKLSSTRLFVYIENSRKKNQFESQDTPYSQTTQWTQKPTTHRKHTGYTVNVAMNIKSKMFVEQNEKNGNDPHSSIYAIKIAHIRSY